jgi:hypothetical protein
MMCRSIKTLRGSEAASPDEIEAAALQFVRKISGMRKPSRVNEEAFLLAVQDITAVSQRMLDTMGLRNQLAAAR